jgi:hypothetical protein
MTSHDVIPDPPLTSEQLAMVDALLKDQVAEIDAALLANCDDRWRKVAAVVGFTMTSEMMAKFKGVPDVYFALRVRNLVDKVLVESTGNIDYML